MNVETQDNGTTQDAAPAEPSVEDEFDAALAEFEDDGAPAGKVAVEPESDDEGKEAAENDPAPADDAAANQQPAEGDEPAPGSDTTQDDPWAEAPANLRELREAEARDNDLRLRSANGRVAAKDRQIADLQRQLQEAQNGRQNPEATQQSDGEDGENSGGNAKGSMSPESLAQLREDYPDLAGPLIDMLEAQSQQLERLSQGVGQFEQTQQSAAIAEQETLLTEAHPDWQAVAADDRFAGWLESQPQSIKTAMARNFDAIVDGNDAALVIDKFKRDVGYQAAAAKRTVDRDPKRERQLQGSRDAGRTGPSSRTGIAKDDFDGAVEAFLQG